jgi:hypothetical protein
VPEHACPSVNWRVEPNEGKEMRNELTGNPFPNVPCGKLHVPPWEAPISSSTHPQNRRVYVACVAVVDVGDR